MRIVKTVSLNSLHSTYFGNETATSSDGDANRYVISRKLLDSIFNIMLLFIK
jgi:hypothetical protein